MTDFIATLKGLLYDLFSIAHKGSMTIEQTDRLNLTSQKIGKTFEAAAYTKAAEVGKRLSDEIKNGFNAVESDMDSLREKVDHLVRDISRCNKDLARIHEALKTREEPDAGSMEELYNLPETESPGLDLNVLRTDTVSSE